MSRMGLARLRVSRRRNRTRVYNDHLRTGARVRQSVAALAELTLDGGGIRLRGSAPELFYVKCGHTNVRIPRIGSPAKNARGVVSYL
jgi:hypothetical protein